MSKSGISLKLDSVKREKFKQVAEFKNTTMNSFIRVKIDEYIDKYYDDFIKSRQQTFKDME